MAESFRAFVVNKSADAFTAGVQERSLADLPAGEVTIRVAYSSVNYKDGLASIADGRVLRRYPLIPGIDLAGVVMVSSDHRFAAGDEVIVTGYDLGVAHEGGFAEYARVPADWPVKLPPGLSLKEAMALGTAGFTAALAIHQLELVGLRPGNGPVLVSGATGGVGSTAVAMLAGLGYAVAASTAKAAEHDYLRGLGATEILSREEVSGQSNRPLESERWAGAIDPVGGDTLAYMLRTTKYRGAVANCGLTGGTALATTVLPFVLRGVNLLGIDSVACPRDPREGLWRRMGADLKPAALLESIAQEVTLEGLPAALATILRGDARGRYVVRLAE